MFGEHDLCVEDALDTRVYSSSHSLSGDDAFHTQQILLSVLTTHTGNVALSMMVGCLFQVCPILCCGFLFALPMADRHAASTAQRGRMRRLRCHWRHVQLPLRMAVAAPVRHRRDRTRTAIHATVQVAGCVEQNVNVPVSQSVEQVVDDSMPQVVIDTVVEQIDVVSVLEFQEGVAEQIVDFAVPPIKEELAETSLSGAHPRAHGGADSGIPHAGVQG